MGDNNAVLDLAMGMDGHVTLINDTNPRANQPSEITTRMKPHQLTMLHACKTIENSEITGNNQTQINSKVGVICDLVGSGKSLSTLSIIAAKKMAPTKEKPSKTFDNWGLVASKPHTDNSKTVNIPLNILVVPHTIVKQWASYINDNTSLSYYMVENKKSYTKFSQKFNTDFLEFVKNDFKEPESLFSYDILLVSSSQFSRVAYTLNGTYDILYNNQLLDKKDYKIVYSRIFYDEADSIKLPNNEMIRANFYWFITSTIMGLINPHGKRFYANHIGELSESWNRDFTHYVYVNGLSNNGFLKTLFDSLTRMNHNDRRCLFLKNSPQFVAESFKLLKPDIREILCESPAIVNVLSGIVSHSIMECINAGDVDSAIEKMACDKVSTKESVVNVFTKKLESELYNKKLELEMVEKMNINPESKKNQIETIVKKITSIEGKIASIRERIVREDLCPICYDKIENQTVVKCCGNSFCFECLTQTFKYNLSSNPNYTSTQDTCPCCRAVLTQDDIMIITKEELAKTGGAGSKKKLTKIEQLEKIVEEVFQNPDRKMLIFSNFYYSFNEISKLLTDKDIGHRQIKGSGVTVNNMIQRYKNEDSLKCLLLNSTNAGAGLNLENTTDLVLFHNMSSEISVQVIGRAQRPGRQNKLNIYRLIYDNEKSNLADISAITN
jgi:SNF2 family DNA or RNA helicase